MINDIIAAGRAIMSNVATFTCEIAMLGLLFVFLFAVMFYFTGFREQWGSKYIVTSLVGMIVITMLYMGLLGANGPPDVSIFFAMVG